MLPTPAPGPNRQWGSAIRYLIISCAQCQEEFKTDRKRKYCAPKCRDKANKAKRPDRHNRDPWHEKTCLYCFKEFKTQDNRSRYCTKSCHLRHVHGWSQSKEMVLRRSPERQTRTWIGHTLEPRNGAPLTTGPCSWCGDNFTGTNSARYCSKKCDYNASWKRRYDRRGEFKVSDRTRQGIYERDNWTCQLCGDPVPKGIGHNEKLSPTLDHIIPQSLQLIPDHSEKNLRLAHLICNAKRGNKMDDLALTA